MWKNIYNKQITILNKCTEVDVDTKAKKDVWYKTILDNCAWYVNEEKAVNGSQVSIATSITVLIPFNENFIEYIDWKKLEDKSELFTMSMGDYVVLGSLDEDVTSSNIVKIMSELRPNVCNVKHVRVADKRAGNVIQVLVEGV